ncbi:MAG: Ldh family oxidoreductase [Chloroflexota bacterium]|nr:Ldh family oxidoreductase [Chloroflexota bacterium]
MIRLTLEEATNLAIARLVRADVPLEQAQIAAPLYLEGELVGRASHGLRHLQNNLFQWELGRTRRTPLTILNETAASALVDGGYQHAYYVNYVAMQKVIEKAQASGIGMVAARKGGGSGLVGYYTRQIAEANLIGIAMHTAPATVVPCGGKRAMLGTNPISIAVPRRNAPPVVVDIATSAGTFNQIMLARLTGEPLPEGMALDTSGQPTTDANAALDENGRGRILPLAGHKGFGLAFAIEILAAAGAGSMLGFQNGNVHHPDYFSSLFMAYRPDLFVSRAEFDEKVEKLIADTKAVERVPGVAEIRLPGEESHRRRATALARGYIEIEEATYKMLNS